MADPIERGALEQVQPQGSPDAVPEIVHASAARADDRQARRYAHTLRRNTPPSVPTLAGSAAVESEQRDISTIAMPKLRRSEGQATANLRTKPPIARSGSEPAIPRPVTDGPTRRASSEPGIHRPSESEASRPSEPDISYASPEPDTAWSSSDPANPASAPTESTAIYRKRNTRPTLPAVADEPVARAETARPVARAETAKPIIVSATSLGGDEAPEDAPSELPPVNLDAAVRRRMLHPVAPHSPLGRLVVPIALVVLLAIATWLLRSIL
ncbi:MAG: hypothetical protein E6J90_48915 [Deltaproteobacteria bacterium]|nr:MAG: hypothetical protein E6J90_48915 [Deltaproteobacteria bacterium]TMQ13240.1 MAG: hypothetical protein E6J91_19100 [Deltaproteobacteria bacterium]